MALDNPYTNEQAERVLKNSPIAGGPTIQPEYTQEDADVIVSETSELERADSNAVVYIADGETVEIAGVPFNLANTALIGGRYKRGVEPGKIKVRTSGLGSAARLGAIRAFSGTGHVEGLRIEGPSWYTDRAEEWLSIDPTDARCWPGYEHIEGGPKDNEVNNSRKDRDILRRDAFSRGVNLRVDGVVRNCEIYGFTHAAVTTGAKNYRPNVLVEHNHLHDTAMPGLGYCVNIYDGTVTLKHNYYNRARHAITGFGRRNLGYSTYKDLYGPDAMLSPVDMHCLAENGGSDGDFTAGKYLDVEHCTFLAGERFQTPGWYDRAGCPAIGIRGRSVGMPYSTEKNQFVHNSQSDALRQVNVPRYTTWEVGENQFGVGNWTPEMGVDADWGASMSMSRRELVSAGRAQARASAAALGQLADSLSIRALAT